jgi:hypothetical protein
MRKMPVTTRWGKGGGVSSRWEDAADVTHILRFMKKYKAVRSVFLPMGGRSEI